VSYEQVEKVIQDKRVACLKLVGSTEAGKKVGEMCGRHMVKATFELGGSDPFIVFEDAELDFAADKAV
jgi:succinate-semialdehyde dehydrogenase / glutarate-semialdehyde dehydrogenase